MDHLRSACIAVPCKVSVDPNNIQVWSLQTHTSITNPYHTRRQSTQAPLPLKNI